MKINRSGIV